MRYKITGAIGLLLGIFKQPPVDDAPDLAPEDRYKNTDPD